MKVNKITTGFVVQVMDPETGEFISQEFVASDDVTYETPYGEPVDVGELPHDGPEKHLPFDMVQP
jgi:hypothetical protein